MKTGLSVGERRVGVGARDQQIADAPLVAVMIGVVDSAVKGRPTCVFYKRKEYFFLIAEKQSANAVRGPLGTQKRPN